MRRIQMIVVGITAAFILLFVLGYFCVIPGVFSRCKIVTDTGKPVELQFWGMYDDSDVYKEIIPEYQTVRKNVTIKYRKVSNSDYLDLLLNEFAANRGPDIWYIHSTWLPKQFDKIQPMPSKTTSLAWPYELKTYRDTFVDVVYSDFVRENSIYAVPLYVDTLALYFNRDLLANKGIEKPAATWEEFIEDVEKLTERDALGRITRAGAAMGTAENVNRSVDVLWLLMLQGGTEMVTANSQSASFTKRTTDPNGISYSPGERALTFYTDFANPQRRVYTWNRGLDYSIDAFAEGDAAMMINYAYHLPTIERKNPSLRFSVAPVPQISLDSPSASFANYWGATVKVSDDKNKTEEAWRFLIWLTEKAQSDRYLDKTKRPPARRDQVSTIHADDFNLSTFSNQSLTAKSWFQIDDLAMSTIFADAIENVVKGEFSPADALRDAETKTNVHLQKAADEGKLPKKAN